jgi:flagella synthesis protein FlgN
MSNSAELLENQQTNLRNLLDVLHAEKKILGLNNPQQLTEIIVQKNELLTTIQSTDNRLSEDSKFSVDVKNGKYSDELSKIDQLLTECKTLNNINGAIVGQSQITINRVRTTILENQGRSSLTYDGKAKTSTGVNTLNIKA